MTPRRDKGAGRVARLALLTAIALTIFMAEAQLPPPVPIQGVKLGLANIVTVYAVFVLGPADALMILTARVFLGAVFSGQMMTLLFSLSGGLLAWGAMSLLREAVSEYQLFSRAQVEAADFITENTPADSLFLTAVTHVNPPAVLSGRNILCGPGLYLYYHGVDYTERESQVGRMFQDGEAFETYARVYGVDYVYISQTERSAYAVDMDYFTQNYPLIYDRDGISIFQIPT